MTLSARRTTYGDIVVVTIRGSGGRDGTRLRAELDKTLADRPQAMIVDFAGAELPDEALPRLMDAVRVAHVQGCRVAVCGLAPGSAERLHLATNRRLPVFSGVEDATQGLLVAGI